MGKKPEDESNEEFTEELQTIVNRSSREVQGTASYRN